MNIAIIKIQVKTSELEGWNIPQINIVMLGSDMLEPGKILGVSQAERQKSKDFG